MVTQVPVAKAMSAESLARVATEMYLKQQDNRSKLFSQWQEQIEDELDDLIFEIDQKKQVFQFDKKTGKLQLGFATRWEVLLREVNYMGWLKLCLI